MVDGFRSPLATDANAGKTAIVTGGGSGIGRATAVELARTGARLAICGRRPEPLVKTRAMLEADGLECLAMQADVREPEQVERFIDAVEERYGSVDVLVNNAGGAVRGAARVDLTEGAARGASVEHRRRVDMTRRVAERWMIPRRTGFVASSASALVAACPR